MYLLFIILMVIAALLMCFIVLIQNSKGGGLASGFLHQTLSWACARLQIFWKSNLGSGYLHGCDERCYCLRCSFFFCS